MKNFYIGDIISTIMILLVFVVIFYVMIKMIKKLKPLSSVASSPPEDTLLRQVDNLTSRVNSLELQVKELSESHHANQVVKTKKSP